jgi:AraC-like DNA-binding protein
LSTSHFHAAFLQQTGFTPSDFRQRHRIQRAKQLLQNTSLSISTIAFDLGFSTSQYFATVFRKITGISPREYRTSVAESH